MRGISPLGAALLVRGGPPAKALVEAPIPTSESQDFDAWGKLVSTTTGARPRHGFVDAEREEAFGTTSFGVRVYDPSLRRWLSPDPLIAANPALDLGAGAQLDLWGYAAGNPVRMTDPRGTCTASIEEGVDCLGWAQGLTAQVGRETVDAYQDGRYGSAVVGAGLYLVGGFALNAVGIAGEVVYGVGDKTYDLTRAMMSGDVDKQDEAIIGIALAFGTEAAAAKLSAPTQKTSTPSRAGRMQKEVERGQAPKEVKRVDRPHVPDQEAHVHFCDGTSCNQSGTTHDAHKGSPSPSKETRTWLEGHGWTPPPTEQP